MTNAEKKKLSESMSLIARIKTPARSAQARKNGKRPCAPGKRRGRPVTKGTRV